MVTQPLSTKTMTLTSPPSRSTRITDKEANISSPIRISISPAFVLYLWKMAPIIEDTPQVPESLLKLLRENLPYSLPLLRRLQFARDFKNGTRPSAHVLFAYHPDTGSQASSAKPSQFAAAYVDMAPRPQTAMWIYSTLEFPGRAAPDGSDDELILALFRRARRIEGEDLEVPSGPRRPARG